MKLAVDNFNNATKAGRDLATGTVSSMSAEGQLTEQQLWEQVRASAVAEHGDNPLTDILARKLFEELKGSMVAPAASRDSGGDGVAGQTYLIGTGAQPELFTAPANGTFTPNAGGMGGTQIQQLVIYANDRAGGRAAADGYSQRMEELDRARG